MKITPKLTTSCFLSFSIIYVLEITYTSYTCVVGISYNGVLVLTTPSSAFNNVTLLASNWPRWEYHRNPQMLQIRAFSPQMLNIYEHTG